MIAFRHCERSEATHDFAWFKKNGSPRFARDDESIQLGLALVRFPIKVELESLVVTEHKPKRKLKGSVTRKKLLGWI